MHQGNTSSTRPAPRARQTRRLPKQHGARESASRQGLPSPTRCTSMLRLTPRGRLGQCPTSLRDMKGSLGKVTHHSGLPSTGPRPAAQGSRSRSCTSEPLGPTSNELPTPTSHAPRASEIRTVQGALSLRVVCPLSAVSHSSFSPADYDCTDSATAVLHHRRRFFVMALWHSTIIE